MMAWAMLWKGKALKRRGMTVYHIPMSYTVHSEEGPARWKDQGAGPTNAEGN